MQKKNAFGGLKRCLCMHTNFPCGGRNYNVDIVEDLNSILLPGLNQNFGFG